MTIFTPIQVQNLMGMKIYKFANIVVRGFPTVIDMNNPYIYGNVKVIINVSGHDYPQEVKEIIIQRGIRCYEFPLTEFVQDMGIDNLLSAVEVLAKEDKIGDKIILHCQYGNNRSRTVAEAFHYKKMGYHLEDEYKGAYNHLMYNCNSGFLPDLAILEGMLR